MPTNTTDLPEGTDKVIAGASSTDTAGGSTATGAQSDPLIASGAAAAPETLGGAGQGGAAFGIDSGGQSGAATGSETGGDIDALDINDSNLAVVGGDTTGTGGAGVLDRVRSGGGKLSGQAADKARGLVGQGLERSAEAIGGVARMIGDTAAGIDERLGEEYGDYARRAAATLESTANNLAAKDADELIDDTRDFVRKSPGIALAGAAIVGFALARLIKTGIAGSGSDEDRRSDSQES